jgi:hypothetical protein
VKYKTTAGVSEEMSVKEINISAYSKLLAGKGMSKL